MPPSSTPTSAGTAGSADCEGSAMKKDASLTARIITGLILFLVTAAASLLRG